MKEINNNLSKLFESNRVIVWYDEEQEYADELSNLELPGISTLTVGKDVLRIKHTVLLVQRSEKFLLYCPFVRPADDDNWLLDIELSNHVFETDPAGLILQELHLGHEFKSWAEKHQAFFKSQGRVSRLQKLGIKDSDQRALTLKMLTVALRSESTRVEDILKKCVEYHLSDKWEDELKALDRFNLEEFFWEFIEIEVAYTNEAPTILDLFIDLFKKVFVGTSSSSVLSNNCSIIIAKWQDMASFNEYYVELLREVQGHIGLEDSLSKYPMEILIQDDLFELVDREILINQAEALEGGVYNESLDEIILERKNKYWYKAKYEPHYQALSSANELIRLISHGPKDYSSFEDGFSTYAESEFKIDQCYRKFIYLHQIINAPSYLEKINELVLKSYSNTWLLKQNENWQKLISPSSWYSGELLQKNYFNREINRRFLQAEPVRKVAVIISDAMRFEIGQELHARLTGMKRFESALEYNITNLPSYTQLGMASLLPKGELGIAEEDLVTHNGKSTAGLAKRAAVLGEEATERSVALNAEELMEIPTRSEKAKELVKGNDLIYVYHNHIDKVGDDKSTESQVFQAAEKELETLIKVVQRLASMNMTHIQITSDHGFIYQHDVVDDSDFINAEIQGETQKESRRYVIGKGLKYNSSVEYFTSESLGLNEGLEILIPKGISRLKRKGSGSRFVHGGATLQEVVTPLLKVVKRKSDTVYPTKVTHLSGNKRITTNIFSARFYQEEPVSATVTKREIKAFLALDSEENVISDSFNQIFEFESERAQDREVVHRFTLSTKERTSNNVLLVLQQKIDGTNTWRTYEKHSYSLMLSMDNDFDDF